MSDSSEGDQRKEEESTSRMWAKSQPGPSRTPPSRQGYCGYCRVLYSNLDQHLSSLRHLDSVRASSRGSSAAVSAASSSSSSRTKLTLLERFLQDVLKHHPHSYHSSPSHADLPPVSAPPMTKEQLDDDRREHLHREGDTEGVGPETLSAPIREQQEGCPAPAVHTQTPPPVHRKAHRKTNRRKTSDSSSSSQPHRRPDRDPGPTVPGPSPDPSPWFPRDPGPSSDPSYRFPTVPGPSPDPSPWFPRDPGPSSDPSYRFPTVPGPSPDPSYRFPTVPGPSPDPSYRFPKVPGASNPSYRFPKVPGPSDPSYRFPTIPGPSDPSYRFPTVPGPSSDPSYRLPTVPGPSDPSYRFPTVPGPPPDLSYRLPAVPGPSDPSYRFPTVPGPTDRGPSPDPGTRFPWLIWQKQRRKVQKEEAFSSDHSDSLDRTIEEVIQMCCHGASSPRRQQEDTESFHFSLPVSMETQSDDWDSPVQVRSDSPVQVSQTEGRSLIRLMDAQVQLEDPVYSYRLDSALQGERPAGGGATDSFLALPIDEVLPAPEHFPESFRGKSWVQIEQEDEEKVEKLVRQFRRGRFLCYFDSESLARYGRRSHNRKEAEPDCNIVPLLDGDDDVSACFRKRSRRGFRMASRCQVVKVSRSTQTLRLVVPAAREPASEAPPPSVPAANQESAERTPVARPWRSLPASYRGIVTPLQPRSQLLFLLCSPSGPAPTDTPPGSAHRRCRRKTRPLERRGSKVTYKRLPVSFYEPGSNRILSNAPRGSAPSRLPGSAPSRPPPCVRQLFRSLSPDLNADTSRSSRVKGSRFPLSALSRDSDKQDKQEAARRRGRASQAPPPAPRGRSERGRGAGSDRTRPQPAKRRTCAPAAPKQPRREGLRRGVASADSPRRGRSRRGRGSERGRS